MENREKLAAAVKRMAWGHLFLLLNLNLGTLNILPNWWGYCLVLMDLGTIGMEEDTAKLLRPLGILLAAWEGIQWFLTLTGESWNAEILGMVMTVMGLYFHFQLLTDLASISRRYDCPETGRLLTLRTVRTVLITLLALPFGWEDMEPVAIFVILVQLLVAAWICSVLFSLARSLRGDQETVDNPPLPPL